MLNREAIYRALRTSDTRKVRRILASESATPENAGIFLAAIKHTGCLIDRFGSQRDDQFHEFLIELAESYLSADPNCVKLFHQHCEDSRIVNAIFKRIKSVVSNLPVNALSPAQQAWGVIDWAVQHLSTLYKRALKPGGKEPFLIRAGVATSQTNDGTHVDIDAMIGATEQYVRMAISMFAFENDWWDQDGKLCLPQRESIAQEHIYRAGAHIDLASVWDLVVSASELLRFSGWKIEFAEIEAGQGSDQRFPAFLFDLNIDERLVFQMAQMRILQLEIDFHMTQMGLPKPAYRNAEVMMAPMPPDSYVSADELLTVALLSGVYHYDIGSTATEKSLSPAKLIRGYAVLKLLFEHPFAHAQFTFIPFDRKRVVAALQNASFSPEEASIFLQLASFGRDSRDMFDCPLIKTASGDEFIFQGLVQFLGLPRVIVSRLNSLGVDFDTKGSVFEEEVRDLLRRHGLSAKEINFNVGAEQYQFDAVVPWGDFVFVFECKNYLLPSDSPAQEFHFMTKMDEAVEQVLRLKSALENNCRELKAQFPDMEDGKTIIPVVLNAMPFSMNRQRKGVYIYDYSALSRFFGGRITASQPIYVDGELIQVEHSLRSLWSGQTPQPEDLIAQMTSPIQLEAEMARWYKDYVTLGLTDRIAMRIPVLRKKESTSDEMLEALKVDGDVRTAFKTLSSEIHRQLRTKSKSKKRKKRRRR